MKRIIISKSKKNKVIISETIHDGSISIKSRASYILLREKLSELDDEFLNEKEELVKWLLFRENLLKEKLEKEKELICVYCGKRHLEIGGRTAKDLRDNNKNPKLATIDHVNPLSNGGKKYDPKNCVVSCKKCNKRKSSMFIFNGNQKLYIF
jgi:hypothetical protein